MKNTVIRTTLLAGIFVLVGSMAPAFAQSPAGGLALPLDYSTFQPPPVGGSYVDPAFGSTVKRISNALGTPNADRGGNLTWITDEYSTMSPFNSDNSKILLVHQSYFGLYDGTGFYLRDLPLEINSSSEPRWSRKDNRTIYYIHGNQFKTYDIFSGAMTIVHTFSEYSSISGMGESDISFDGDHFVFAGDGRYVFVYRISADAKSATFDTGGSGFDSVYITPNNNVIVSWDTSGSVRYTGQELFDGNMNFLRQVGRADGHKDVTLDTDGNEVLVWTNSNDPQPICNNGIVKIRLADGQQTCLASLDWSLAVHISAPDNSGFVYVETYAPSNPTASSGWAAYTNELLQIKLDGSQVLRLAHHRSRPFQANTYNWQPKMSTSRDGSRVVYNSDYDLQAIDGYADEYSDVYLMVVGSPATSTPAPVPPPTPTPTLALTTTTLTSGTTGASYSQTLAASGGTAPYAWALTSGTLPAGLSLAGGGAITGTPATAGTSSFAIQVADGASATASQSFSLTVVPAATCSYSISPGAQAFGASGGSGTIGVTAGSGCAWMASGAPGWVSVAGASGTGSGTVTYQVQANTGAAQSGSIVIAGLTFTVVEQASASVVYTVAGSMAQVASGGSWTTTITLMNNGPAPAHLRLNFFDDNGGPLTLPLTFPQALPAASLMAATLDRTLGAGAGLVIATNGLASQATQQGWAQLLTDGSVSGFAVFASAVSGGAQEAVTPLQGSNTGSWVLWFDNSGGYATGVALANLASAAATVPVIVRDDTGTILASSSVALAALAHGSFMVSTQYPQTAGKRGSIEFQTTTGGQIGVLGLRASGSGALTSVPALAK